MTQNKTIATNASVEDFVNSLSDLVQRKDSRQLLQIFKRVSGEKPVMWGSAIIGFGLANLKYASGRNVDWLQIGFSPRVGKISIYVTFDAEKLTKNFPKLGKFKIGKGCIYINHLSDVDLNELENLIRLAYKTGYEQPNRADGKEQIIEL